jgi:hypothetical protein
MPRAETGGDLVILPRCKSVELDKLEGAGGGRLIGGDFRTVSVKSKIPIEDNATVEGRKLRKRTSKGKESRVPSFQSSRPGKASEILSTGATAEAKVSVYFIEV